MVANTKCLALSMSNTVMKMRKSQFSLIVLPQGPRYQGGEESGCGAAVSVQ